MSRVAKKPITIPKGVEVKINAGVATIKGPKGQLNYCIDNAISVTQADGCLVIAIKSQDELTKVMDPKFLDSLSGTTRARLNNLVDGVTQGYEKKLLLVGVGYRAQAQGKKVNLSLGFSHPVSFSIPEGITIDTPVPTEIIIKGADKHLVGQVAANIRKVRKVERYKGKGVRYSDERVVLKETKKK